MNRARSENSNVVVLISSDVILLEDFFASVEKVRYVSGDWILASSSWLVSEFPFHVEKKGNRFSTWKQGENKVTEETVRNFFL